MNTARRFAESLGGHVALGAASHHRGVLALGAVVLFAAGVTAADVKLDFSFRPVFVEDAALEAASERFEATFGQLGNGHIGALYRVESVADAGFLDTLETTSAAVAELPHVGDVWSLTRAVGPGEGADAFLSLPLLDPADRAGWSTTVKRLRAERPEVLEGLVDPTGQWAVLWARVDLPLDDDRRASVVEGLRSTVEAKRRPRDDVHFVGYSVVEQTYRDVMRVSLGGTVAATLALVALLLLAFLGRARAAAAALSGVGLAGVVTLGAMAALDKPITIVSSIVLNVVLLVGLCDAIHMVHEYRASRKDGLDGPASIERMGRAMWLPCLLTTVTTAAGLLSLLIADLPAMRDFGLCAAIGVAAAFVANQLLVPSMLSALPPDERKGLAGEAFSVLARHLGVMVVRAPRRVAAVAGFGLLASVAALPQLSLDQRTNEELPSDHPIRVGQAALEAHLGGYLGPDLHVIREDGEPLIGEDDVARLRELGRRLAAIDDVQRTASYADLLPDDLPGIMTEMGIDGLRQDAATAPLLRSFLTDDNRQAAVIVRTGDIGTQRALRLAERVSAEAGRALGDEYRVELVGTWWRCILGMSRLLDDLVASFLLALLFVLPMLLTVARRRLFVLSLLPNLLPMVCALGFLAATGMGLRIGTGMMLSLALGIAVDDTLHFVCRLGRELERGATRSQAVLATLREAGEPILLTSVVLVLGMAAMGFSDFLAVRQMGAVGAFTLLVATVADLVLLPALFLSWPKRRERRPARPVRRERGLRADLPLPLRPLPFARFAPEASS